MSANPLQYLMFRLFRLVPSQMSGGTVNVLDNLVQHLAISPYITRGGAAMAGTVLILGAGASATPSSGGPLTRDILPGVLGNKTRAEAKGSEAKELQEKLELFLNEMFHVGPGSPPENFPGLPLLMSLLDTALGRGVSV
jgi:hypothetical protein